MPGPLLLEAALLRALEAGPAGLIGIRARARLLLPQHLPALENECTLVRALERLHRERWISVLNPGPAPRYQLTGLGEARTLWHGERGTLRRDR
ncbi:hypothetical protein [Deinococcus hopiensis]|uniref:Uncharacterized protein n=1 Tax=Deinococcus hopiensis KR-140 TaxID=695939 RepID=A0A1W1UXQ0_9DEIO|nr:hypothetical protein [Deinococcus hopiensis]SMB85846.1 hypothetical protein SAMN00790413_03564 [Deinococcus hopiensis KR-140]